MKKLLLLPIALSLSACCGSALQVLSDDNYYYPNWCKYNQCYQKNGHAECYLDGQYVETIYPLTPNQVSEIRRNEDYQRQLAREITNSLNSIPRTTTTNCYSFGNYSSCTTR